MELQKIKKPYAYRSINNIAVFTIVVFTLYLLFSISSTRPATHIAAEDLKTIKSDDLDQNCDIFTGEWVPDPNAPYYTNTTCRWIHDKLNCMKNGEPDLGFLKWRWRPDGCELPPFDPFVFLDLVRDKTMAFVGDSLSLNHMHSMSCLLSGVSALMLYISLLQEVVDFVSSVIEIYIYIY